MTFSQIPRKLLFSQKNASVPCWKTRWGRYAKHPQINEIFLQNKAFFCFSETSCYAEKGTFFLLNLTSWRKNFLVDQTFNINSCQKRSATPCYAEEGTLYAEEGTQKGTGNLRNPPSNPEQQRLEHLNQKNFSCIGSPTLRKVHSQAPFAMQSAPVSCLEKLRWGRYGFVRFNFDARQVGSGQFFPTSCVCSVCENVYLCWEVPRPTQTLYIV